MLHTHVRTLSQAERESEMGDNLEEEGKLTVHMWFFFLVCVRTVRVRVCVCVDLRSVLRLSVKSRSERLCPGLEEERGGLSPSSVVSSEKRTKETTTLPMMLFKKINGICWLRHKKKEKPPAVYQISDNVLSY